MSVLDISLARDVLAWSPKLSFSDGMGRTLSDFRRNAMLSNLD